jgi:hypothetical protein
MENRRDFLQRTAFGLAALGVAGAAHARVPEVTPGPVGVDEHWLLAPLRVGDEIGLGWSLARVFPPAFGAVTLNLRHEGGRVARVDMSMRGTEARGPAASQLVEFIVMDGGDGKKEMAESLGRALKKLAAVVAANELRDIDSVAALMPHADRVLRHADVMAHAARRLEPGIG